MAESVMISVTTACEKNAQTAHALLHGDDMRKLLSIALCLPLAACVIGDLDPGSGVDPGGDPPGGTDDGAITGLITQDTTWSGTVLIGYDRTLTQIEPNVTVTVAPGTQIKFKPGKLADGTSVPGGLVIKGALRVQGTSADKVTLEPVNDVAYGLGVEGTLELTYAVMARGAIRTNPGSTTTITDTLMSKAAGDLLMPSGGTVTVTYSQIGLEQGDTTHCQIHTSGDANTISITRSNIIGAPYGLMLYSRGAVADLKNNNWYVNEIDIDTQPNANGDVSGSYFDGQPPAARPGATLTANNLSQTRLTDAGVRP